MEKQRRTILPPKVHSSVIHGLFFIPMENKYIVVPSSSTSFPKAFNEASVQKLDTFAMKDAFDTFQTYYIGHSSSLSEINRMQQKLQKHIDEGKTVDANSSLRFLRESFSQEENAEEEQEMIPRTSGSISMDASFTTNTLGRSSSHLPSHPTAVDLLERILETLQMISTQIDKLNKRHDDVAKDVDRCRKTLIKVLNKRKGTPAAVDTVQAMVEGTTEDHKAPGPREPVMHDGIDLVKVGRGNMDIVAYGVRLARHLWSDDDLANGRLLPSRSRGRPSLDEEKTILWSSAVRNRFSLDDDDDIKPAVRAVNQLGVDVKMGKRRRLQ